jgi:hypothetical protein
MCYAFEALCMMNQPTQAFHLVPPQEMQQIFLDIKNNVGVTVPGLMTLQQSLLLNLAVIYITQNQLTEAQEMLNTVNVMITQQQQVSLRVQHTLHLTQIYVLVAQDKKKAIEFVQSSTLFPPEIIRTEESTNTA